jgi:hypothetical protein
MEVTRKNRAKTTHHIELLESLDHQTSWGWVKPSVEHYVNERNIHEHQLFVDVKTQVIQVFPNAVQLIY